jgi:hypothetical protein
MFTPGGHRRYRRGAIRELLTGQTPERAFAEDAVRLYEQGWSDTSARWRMFRRHVRCDAPADPPARTGRRTRRTGAIRLAAIRPVCQQIGD